MAFYVYILRCSDGTLYTGHTKNLERRLKEHKNGNGARYTKSRRPLSLVYHETYKDRGSAMKREYEIKDMEKQEKEELVRNNWN